MKEKKSLGLLNFFVILHALWVETFSFCMDFYSNLRKGDGEGLQMCYLVFDLSQFCLNY